MRRFALAVLGGWLVLGGSDGASSLAQDRPRREPFLIDQYLVPASEFRGQFAGAQPVLIDAVHARFSPYGEPFGWTGLPLQPAYVVVDEPLPAGAQALIKVYDADIAEIQKKADEEKRQRREKAIAALQELQDKYTREAKLDEAVAIRDRIRRLKMADLPIFRDPGSLYQFHSQLGKSFLFEVVGSLDGSLWGTEVYTGDSTLAKAAVHMGVLKPGQKGIVKVTIVASPTEHKASTQNGVTSSSYGAYSFSYTVEPFREPAKPQ